MMLECLNKLLVDFSEYRIVFPVHPRTHKMLEGFNLEIPQKVLITEPLSFLNFIELQTSAKLVITDSGSIQEETCLLQVPCITIRTTTERPETVRHGMNILVGLDECKLALGVQEMLNKEIVWLNLFGEYGVGERLVNLLRTSFNKLDCK